MSGLVGLAGPLTYSTMTKLIPLYRGKDIVGHTQVDDDKFDELNQFKWQTHENEHYPYPKRRYNVRDENGKWHCKTEYLHRRVFGVTDPKVKIDHLDHDVWNNQAYNLAPGSGSDNSANAHRRKSNRSGYKGVSLVKVGKRYLWKAGIHRQGRGVGLGYFEDLMTAVITYDLASIVTNPLHIYTNLPCEAYSDHISLLAKYHFEFVEACSQADGVDWREHFDLGKAVSTCIDRTNLQAFRERWFTGESGERRGVTQLKLWQSDSPAPSVDGPGSRVSPARITARRLPVAAQFG